MSCPVLNLTSITSRKHRQDDERRLFHGLGALGKDDICKSKPHGFDWDPRTDNAKVLACSIVLVFFAGLGKLWWINRSVRKHEQLDEEKKSRMEEIQRVGIPVRRRPEIPFGVRAIQSGVEVDGIWISRPGTPNSQTPTADSVTKGKSKMSADVVGPSPDQSPSSSIFETSSSPPRSPTMGPQATYKPRHVPNRTSSRTTESFNAESLDKLEDNLVKQPTLRTYRPRSTTPTAPVYHAMTTGGRSSSSSDEVYVPSHQSSLRTHTRRMSPFPHIIDTERDGYFPSPQGSPENPFTTPDGGRTRQVSNASSFRLPTAAHAPTVAAPVRSYSGETHVNRASRKVNAGFEVLPAGTFGPDPQAHGSDVDLERGEGPKGSTRLSRSVIQKIHRKDSSQ